MAKKPSKAEKSSVVKKLIEMTSEEIKRLSAKEAKSMLSAARSAMYERLESLAKATYGKKGGESKTFYSAEYERQRDWVSDHFDSLKKAPSKTNKAEANAELQRYAKFFRAKSSTVAGAREIMKKQDARIFGVDENGNPLDRMTRSQRENFWTLYDEFMTGESTAALGYLRYASLQKEIGKYIKQRKRDERGKFVGFDLGTAIEDLRGILSSDDYDTRSESILSGSGIDF